MAESAKNNMPCNLLMKSPADKVSDIFRNKCYLFQTIMPQDVKNVTKISADVWLWTFVDDKCGSWKYTVKPSGDTEPIKWTLLEGEVPKKHFDRLEVDYQFSASGNGCMAKAELSFDKKSATVPDPNDYIDFILKMFKAVDEYLQNPKH